MAKDTSRKATPRENVQPKQGSVSRAAKKGTALPKRKAVRVAAPSMSRAVKAPKVPRVTKTTRTRTSQTTTSRAKVTGARSVPASKEAAGLPVLPKWWHFGTGATALRWYERS